MHVHRLAGEEMASGSTMGRRQASGGHVMLLAMFCWENLGNTKELNEFHTLINSRMKSVKFTLCYGLDHISI